MFILMFYMVTDNMENLSATNEILSMISPEGERVAFGKASNDFFQYLTQNINSSY